jgi:hypothetical protein
LRTRPTRLPYAARSAAPGWPDWPRAALGHATAVGLVAAAPALVTAIAARVLADAASVTVLSTGNATIQLASDPEYRSLATALWPLALRAVRRATAAGRWGPPRTAPGWRGGR